MSVPAGYCEEGTRLRMTESDARQIMEEERRRASTWHARLKAARARLLEHREGCADCAAKPLAKAVAS